MRWNLPRPRFGLRTLLILVLACGIGLAFWTNPGRWRTFRNQQARQRIDPYELKIAGDGNPRNVPPELVAILGDSRLKHWGRIEQVEILPNDTLATRGRDHVLSIWNLKTLQRAHSHDVKAFALSRDGTRSFVVRADDQLEMWNPLTNRKLSTLQKLANVNYHFLASNEDGSRLAVESVIPPTNCERLVIDVARNVTLWSNSTSIGGGGHLALDPRGEKIAWTERDTLLVASLSSSESPQRFGPLPNEEGRLDGLGHPTFLPDRNGLLAAGPQGIVEIDFLSGEVSAPLPIWQERAQGIKISNKGDGLLVWGGSRVTSFGSDRTRWEEQWEFPFLHGGIRNLSLRRSLLVAAHIDGSLTFSNSYKPGMQWRLPNGGLGPDITSLAFNPRGDWLATGCRDGEMVLWSTGTWGIIRRWKAHVESIAYLVASRDGKQLISSSEDGSVVVWNPLTGHEAVSIDGFQVATALSLSADGKRLATYDRGSIHSPFWNLPSGSEMPPMAIPWGRAVGAWSGSGRGILTPLFSPDGKTVAARDHARNVIFADAQTLKISSQAKSMGATLTPRAWFPDGKRIVLLEGTQTLLVYDTQAMKTVQTFQLTNNAQYSVAIHPSGKWLAICGWSSPVEIWYVPTAKLVKSWQIGPPKGVVSQVEFSPDGHYLATVNGNGTAYVVSLDGVLDP